jgi:UDP-N-acetyl-D-mannosaminuronate dehydrogenase
VQETATRSEGIGAARRFRIAHAEDPAHPGQALCGTKLNGKVIGASAERCVVCLDLARRTFVGR